MFARTLVFDLAGKQVFGDANLDTFAVEKEGGSIGEAPGLLHQIGDQENRHFLAQLLENVLDAHRGNRIDSDRELVEHQQIRFLRQRSGDRQALLLTTRQQAAEGVQAILDFVPESRAGQTALHDDVQVGLVVYPAQPGRQGHVVVYGHRQAHRQRKDDTDAATQGIDVLQSTGIATVETDFALHLHSRREDIHPVDRLEQ
jgi:hypothetical protein